ncbi:hypothetical protein [Mycoplasmopsis gallopavonis]|uniref:DUF3137 domain-containing protein n=1 Tax=Mycoplasmopsis gallopavonis TaxID=76629 RepID=A0A449B0G1_9BACT|nr:hypothetical protein [Mycoplasmopsis gallopavonis]RIV16758.1 hypothetical protein D1113_01035 [Mycoplasmopsis gallopavonis]VEU73253.1 Uncharacterised protein [Mycoplasmopsis gallopavonis]
MKRVNDFLSFEKFTQKTNQAIYPKLKTLVDEAVEPYLPEIKKINIWFWSLLGSGLFLLLLTAILFSRFQKSIIISSFGFIGLCLLILSFVFRRLKNKKYQLIATEIFAKTNLEQIYATALESNELEWKIWKPKSSEIHEFLEKIKAPDFWRAAPGIPSRAKKHSWEVKWAFSIREKYQGMLVQVVWIERIAKKDHVEIVYHYDYKVFLDTSALKSEGAYFEINSNLWGLEKQKLENDQFNKMFRLRSNDDLSMRKIFTPYSQEVCVNRQIDNDYSIIKKINILATPEIMLTSFVGTKFNFELRSFNTSNSSKIIRTIYDQSILDLYTLYFILSFYDIPIYLK